jgi:hypothetical protein
VLLLLLLPAAGTAIDHLLTSTIDGVPLVHVEITMPLS